VLADTDDERLAKGDLDGDFEIDAEPDEDDVSVDRPDAIPVKLFPLLAVLLLTAERLLDASADPL
jgi:hypothetical protein